MCMSYLVQYHIRLPFEPLASWPCPQQLDVPLSLSSNRDRSIG